jgi:hypothetical protein
VKFADLTKMGEQKKAFRPSFFERIAISLFHLINRVVPWFKLPTFLGAINLALLRIELRGYNLHDGYASGSEQGSPGDTPMKDERFQTARNSDGQFNSLEQPRMGCTGMRFGRNFPREHCQKPTEEELWSPNPRIISEKFMARKEGGFIPATTLNLLAAAWIQFQTHDWFNHELEHASQHLNMTTRGKDLRTNLLCRRMSLTISHSLLATPGRGR